MLALMSCYPPDDKSNDAKKSEHDTEIATQKIKVPDNLIGSFLISQFAVQNDDVNTAYNYAKKVITLGGYNPKAITFARYFAFVSGDVVGGIEINKQLKTADRDDMFYVLAFYDAYQSRQWQQANEYAQSLKKSSKYKYIQPLFQGWLSIAMNKPHQEMFNEQNYDESLRMLVKLQNAGRLIINGNFADAEKAIESVSYQSQNIPIINIATLVGTIQQQGEIIDKNKLGVGNELSEIMIKMADEKLIPVMKDPAKGLFYLLQDLSQLSLVSGQYENSLIYNQLARNLMPENVFLTIYLADLLRDMRLTQQADLTYQKIPSTHPLHWLAQVYRVGLYIKQGDNQTAINIIIPLAEKYTHVFNIKKLYADLLKQDRQFERAIKIYDTLIDTPQNKLNGEVYYSRAVCYERLNQWPLAEADFTKAIKLNPNDATLLNYLAYSWINRNLNMKKAEQLLSDAMALSPRNPDIMDSLAWLYYKQGKYDAALSLLKSAAFLSPDDPVILNHYGDLLWSVNHKLNARYMWTQALEMLKLSKDQRAFIGEVTADELLKKINKSN